MNHNRRDLFGDVVFRPSLPANYAPVCPDHFQVSRIYLARGSVATPERRRFVEGICSLYPDAQVEEGWQEIYTAFTERLIETVPIQRLTLGGVCICLGARKLMERKMGAGNAISANIDDLAEGRGW
jgi:hypothetical protein